MSNNVRDQFLAIIKFYNTKLNTNGVYDIKTHNVSWTAEFDGISIKTADGMIPATYTDITYEAAIEGLYRLIQKHGTLVKVVKYTNNHIEYNIK